MKFTKIYKNLQKFTRLKSSSDLFTQLKQCELEAQMPEVTINGCLQSSAP